MEAWALPYLPFHLLTDATGRVAVGPPFDEVERIVRRLDVAHDH